MLTLISALSRRPYPRVDSSQASIEQKKGVSTLQMFDQKNFQTLLSKSERGAVILEKTACIVMLALSLATIALGAIALAGTLPLGSTGAIVMVVVGGAVTGDALVAMLVGLYCDRPAYRLRNLSKFLDVIVENDQSVHFPYSNRMEIIFTKAPGSDHFYPTISPLSRTGSGSGSEGYTY